MLGCSLQSRAGLALDIGGGHVVLVPEEGVGGENDVGIWIGGGGGGRSGVLVAVVLAGHEVAVKVLRLDIAVKPDVKLEVK